MYSFKLRRTIPIFSSYQTGLDTDAYASHFYYLFLYNPSLITQVRGEWKLQTNGFLVDFADSQRNGFLKACGMFVLTKRGVLKTASDYDTQAVQIGKNFSRFLHGCEFHFKQSVRKVKSNTQLVPFDKRALWGKCIDRLLSEETDSFEKGVKDIRTNFPNVESWLKWWLLPQHAAMIFPTKKEMDKVSRTCVAAIDKYRMRET